MRARQAANLSGTTSCQFSRKAFCVGGVYHGSVMVIAAALNLNGAAYHPSRSTEATEATPHARGAPRPALSAQPARLICASQRRIPTL